MLPAAKKGDLCLHQGKIITGSPDTTTTDKPSARLGDQHDCKSHPPGFPPWPPGPIVTASPTVFINRLKAARHTDLLQCGAPGPPPPGTANPITEEYQVREEDSYHELMAIEHEIQERDRVKDEKEPAKGQVGEADDPTGVAEAQAPPKVTKEPSASAITYQGKKGDRQNPYAKESDQFKRDHQARVLGSEIDDPAMAGEVGVGSVSAGVVVARKEDGPGEKTKPRKDEQKNRYTITLNLGFAMELSVGTRSTTVRAGAPMDMIVPLPYSVWIGGPVPPAPPPIEPPEE